MPVVFRLCAGGEPFSCRENQTSSRCWLVFDLPAVLTLPFFARGFYDAGGGVTFPGSRHSCRHRGAGMLQLSMTNSSDPACVAMNAGRYLSSMSITIYCRNNSNSLMRSDAALLCLPTFTNLTITRNLCYHICFERRRCLRYCTSN